MFREVGRDRALLGLLAAGLILRLTLAWAARNLATGAGFTADTVHPTSGFQPLYTFLLVPLYLLLPKGPILPVHLALSILAVCGAATGWFVFRIARRLSSRRATLFSLFLWSFSPYFLSQRQHGLETGLSGPDAANFRAHGPHLGGLPRAAERRIIRRLRRR